MRTIKLETMIGLFMIMAIIVFLFMSFKIGIWRIDTIKYAHYIIYFNDVSGLNEKADVFISGVKVGWINKLSLLNRNKHVRIDLMIDRNSIIYANATAVIRQNGLLGTKYIDLQPGDNSYPILPPESTLMNPSKGLVSIDELLHAFKDIADNVNAVSSSLKNIFTNDEQGKNLVALISRAEKAFSQIEQAAESTKFMINNNNDSLNNILKNLNSLTNNIKNTLPESLNNFTKSTKSIADSISSTTLHINNTLKPLNNVFNKLENGDGLMGALFKDDKLIKNVQSTVTALQNYFSYVDRLTIDLDIHLESMQGLGNDLDFKDAKGYFNFWIRPSHDFYYIAGITSSYGGLIKRHRIDTQWYSQDKHQIVPSDIPLDNWAKLLFAPVKEEYVREYDALSLNIQIAKEFGRLQCRAGLFEGSFGIALDYDIPLALDNSRWITSLEIFKWNEFLPVTLGNRLKFDIDMPHFKWWNRIFFNDCMYGLFGVDDFISKYNSNFFAGFGILFEQTDLKYLSSNLHLK